MKRFLLPVMILLMLGCNKEFEPELSGWKAYTIPARPLVRLDINGRKTTVRLPGGEGTIYRFPQWTKFQDRILLTQRSKTDSCYDYQVIAIDTTGAITDTVYRAPPNTAINFKLAPNDSLLLLKSYEDDCHSSDHYRYTFYNRYSKKALPDTIHVDNARGILLDETVWSPDSRKVIFSEWSGRLVAAYTYDLVTKDTTYIDRGTNFIWSPSDNDLVAYIKDFSIHTRNIKTGEKEIIYEGKKKRAVTDFRWSPGGDFLMIHLKRYFLNVEAGPLQNHTIIYYSLNDRNESTIYHDSQRIDTWRATPPTLTRGARDSAK